METTCRNILTTFSTGTSKLERSDGGGCITRPSRYTVGGCERSFVSRARRVFPGREGSLIALHFHRTTCGGMIMMDMKDGHPWSSCIPGRMGSLDSGDMYKSKRSPRGGMYYVLLLALLTAQTANINMIVWIDALNMMDCEDCHWDCYWVYRVEVSHPTPPVTMSVETLETLSAIQTVFAAAQLQVKCWRHFPPIGKVSRLRGAIKSNSGISQSRANTIDRASNSKRLSYCDLPTQDSSKSSEVLPTPSSYKRAATI